MKFKYRAIKKEGIVHEGTLDAKDKNDVYKVLKKEGSTLVSVSVIKKNDLQKFDLVKFLTEGKIKTNEKIIFARNLGSMIDAGLPLSRSLSIMERQSKNKKFKRILLEIMENVKKGKTFNESLSNFPDVFSNMFVSMAEAGEESGKLAESLKIVSDQMERMNKLRKKIKGAMMYPSVIFSAMILIGILMLIFVVPTLTATFEELGADLPTSTQLIINVSDFFQNNMMLAFIIILFVIGFGIYFFKSSKFKKTLSYIILKIPVIKELVKETNSARTANTLSSLISSGVDIVRSVEITQSVIQNYYYKEVLNVVKNKIQKGELISEIFKNNENLYPAFVGEMIAVGEETGKLPEMLSKVARFYEEEVEQKTKDMSTIIEPFLMIVIAMVVGFFAISMISPMYSLSSSF